MRMIVGRPADIIPGGHDTLVAYRQFTYWVSRVIPCTNLDIRASVMVGLDHPFQKRFAIEYSVPTFSEFHNTYDYTANTWRGYDDATLHSHVMPNDAGYSMEPLIPEEITALFYGTFAEGATGVQACEAFDNITGARGNGNPAVFGPAPRHSPSQSPLDSVKWIHSYNIGHRYSCRDTAWHEWVSPTNSDVDGPLDNYYLGFSNTYRAILRATSRLNAIWGNGPHPVKNMRWFDAHTTNGGSKSRCGHERLC
jgi:hypothetical protein